MKILVLNGSPKRDKSDTMHIAHAFLEGMKEAASQDMHIIHTIDHHIEYCTGCFSCMRNGGTCVHDDDMREILEEILASDLLIWSFPLYCYGMPASLKALLDRTLPLSSMAMQKIGEPPPLCRRIRPWYLSSDGYSRGSPWNRHAFRACPFR